jgi:uncharacterized protein
VSRLLVNGIDVSAVVIADTPAKRRRGLLGQSSCDSSIGSMWFPGIRSVHTFRMQFTIDVAHIDAGGTVIRTQTMAPGKVGRWVRRSSAVLEAEAGSFDRWNLTVGSQVELSA